MCSNSYKFPLNCVSFIEQCENDFWNRNEENRGNGGFGSDNLGWGKNADPSGSGGGGGGGGGGGWGWKGGKSW